MINFISFLLSFSIINTPILTTESFKTTNSTKNNNNLISNGLDLNYYVLNSRPLIEKKENQEKEVQKKKQILLEKEQKEFAKKKPIENQRKTLTKKTQKVINYKKTETPKATKSYPIIQSDIANIICHWTNVYGGDCGYHIKIAQCESGLRSGAIGGGGKFLGVFQQHKDYWPGRAAKFGFPGASALDANANIAVSIAMMRTMGYSHWSCA